MSFPRMHLGDSALGTRYCSNSGYLYLIEGDTHLIFRRGETRCWIRKPDRTGWRPHTPTNMINPFKRYSYDFWTNPNREQQWQRSAAAKESAAVYQWLLTLPCGISKQLAEVDESLFWGALCMLSRIDCAKELFLDNPAWTLLAYYQYEPADRSRTSFHFAKVRRILMRPRSNLMKSLDVHHPASAVRILKKIELSTLSLDGLRTVVDFLRVKQNPLRKYFEHCDTTSVWFFETALTALSGERHERPRLDLCYLRQLEKSDRGHQLEHAIYYPDVIEMERQLGVGRKPIFKSVEQMINYHDSLIWRHFNTTGRAFHKVTLPPPLIPPATISSPRGEVTIKHLESGDQVMAHAQAQKNCILSYIPRVQLGNATIYAVHSRFAPLHTLAVVKRLDGTYTFQCAQAENRNPDYDIFTSIYEWFQASELISKTPRRRGEAPQSDLALVTE